MELTENQFLTLDGLGFGDNELAALRRQGFVSREQRGPGHAPIYKLRFRLQGAQRTRYLGSDLDLIREVQHELAQLQAPARHEKKLNRLVRQAWRVLQRAKSTLAPVLAAQGCHYHGLAIRHRRSQTEAPPKKPGRPARPSFDDSLSTEP